MVCSGDLLPDGTDCDSSIYLCFEGKFLKGMLITIYSIFGASMLSVIIVAICVHKRHTEEDKKAMEAAGADMSDLGGKKQSKALHYSNRVSAFTKALDPDYEAAMRESRYSGMSKNTS